MGKFKELKFYDYIVCPPGEEFPEIQIIVSKPEKLKRFIEFLIEFISKVDFKIEKIKKYKVEIRFNTGFIGTVYYGKNLDITLDLLWKSPDLWVNFHRPHRTSTENTHYPSSSITFYRVTFDDDPRRQTITIMFKDGQQEIFDGFFDKFNKNMRNYNMKKKI